MKTTSKQTAEVILGMREAYAAGRNAMEWCREYYQAKRIQCDGNNLFSTLVAYDLQAGSYISAARRNAENNRRWCKQLAGLFGSTLTSGDSVLEVGVGEATTLAGVLKEIDFKPGFSLGFDVSWSRVAEGRQWLKENGQEADLFVADLLNIPLADRSVDVVYSSHSLEPNRGREVEAVSECLRVARKAVILVEPIYELASAEAQVRMKHHGYVENLRGAAERLGAIVADYRLLEYSSNPLNPSGVVFLKKVESGELNEEVSCRSKSVAWSCPITGLNLQTGTDYFYTPEVGLAYPVLRGIPMLRGEHAMVASKLSSTGIG